MRASRITSTMCLLSLLVPGVATAQETAPATAGKQSADQHRQIVKAIYIPRADQYAGIVSYEKYRDEMKHADYQIERMKSWPLLRAYFMSGEVDMAYVMCPLAMDMFHEKPNFRWVGLMHRDGNALAINDLINAYVNVAEKRIDRKPDAKVAAAFAKAKREFGHPT